jgi:hypothetical protein
MSRDIGLQPYISLVFKNETRVEGCIFVWVVARRRLGRLKSASACMEYVHSSINPLHSVVSICSVWLEHTLRQSTDNHHH